MGDSKEERQLPDADEAGRGVAELVGSCNKAVTILLVPRDLQHNTPYKEVLWRYPLHQNKMVPANILYTQRKNHILSLQISRKFLTRPISCDIVQTASSGKGQMTVT